MLRSHQARSSPVSAIHFASTSSESGSRALPYDALVGKLDAVLVQHRRVCGR